MRLSSALLVVVATAPLAAAGPARAAAPDVWTRWAASPREATVRSLDFVGPNLFGASEDDGVFSAPSAAGPWSQRNGGLEAPGADSVRQIKASPGGALYAATSAGLFTAPAGGGNWSPVGAGPGPRKLGGGIQSIVFNDASGTNLTVAVAGAAGPGVYVSFDSGANWDRASGMPAGENVFHLTSAPGGTPLYAAADDGVFVSPDFGRSWTLASDGIPPGETTLRVAVQPDDPSILWASTSSGVYRSTAGGATWAEAGGFDDQILPGGGKRAFLLAPALGGQFGAGRAVVGTESGAWVTIDGGTRWAKMSSTTAAPDASLPFGQRVVQSLGLGFSPPSLLAGTSGFGVFGVPMQPIESLTTTVAPSNGLTVGTRLVASAAATGTRPFFFTYVWRRCTGAGCTPSAVIPGATASSYTIPTSDANLRVRYSVSVVGRNLVLPGSVSDASTPTEDADIPAVATSAPRPSFVVADQPSLSPTAGAVPTPRFGQVFTIDPGKWRTEGSSTQVFPVFSYRWSRCDGATCTEIPGVTGPSYTSAPKDIGLKIRGEVRGTTAAGGPSAFFLAGTSNTVVNRFPVVTVAPKVVGDPVTGTTLGSSAGGWDGFQMTYERRWLRCEADGLGCNPTTPVVTTSTYALTAADRGKRLQLEVTAVAADPNQPRRTVALSAPTAVVADPPPPAVAVPGPVAPIAAPGPGPSVKPVPPTTSRAPTIVIKRGKTLRRGTPLSVPSKLSGFKKLTYRWLRNGKAIKRATKRTYKLTRADRGRRIACRITLTRTNGIKLTVTTKAVKVPKRLRG